ncbi:hypothetical protein Peur_070971 [Populus x canadensis]
MYMVAIDHVLRPGRYCNDYQALQRPKKGLEEEQRKIEEVAKLLSWEKRHEIGEIAIWHKRINNDFFREQDPKPTMLTPYPGTDEVTGAAWQPFSEKLNVVPSRISSGSIPGLSVEKFLRTIEH